MIVEPFLYRFKTMCGTQRFNDCEYDFELDMLVCRNNNSIQLAINNFELGTKKENLEKGEDEGPNLLWN